MTDFVSVLTTMGEHFPLVAIGCLEAVAGIVLLGKNTVRKNKKKETGIIKGSEKAAVQELGRQKEETFVILRTEDLMPVCAGENLEKLTGITYEQLTDDVTELWKIAKEPAVGKKFWKTYRAWNGKDIFKYGFQNKNDQWIQTVIERNKDQGHDLMVFRNVTEIQKMIREYREKIEDLEEESQSKTTFLSRMSHEIRTPMNGIIGMVTLAEGKLDADHPAMQYLGKVDELSDHLLSLINDILDMSRIEAGKVELEQKPLSLRELGDRLYNMFARNLKERGIHYEVNFEDVTTDYVIGDELRISQIIINFLSNAVKFTEEGEITVTFRQMLRRDGIVDLMICVHDTGIGMSTEFVNRIFRPFEQEGIDVAKKYGGTGLGMAITDQLVKLMGGEIVVKSEVGKGSDFSVFLRLPEANADEKKDYEEKVSQEEQPVEKHYTFNGRRILMAEDNEVNAMIGQEILESMGAEVEIAEDGQEVVDAFALHPAGYYDFILMDVQMPVMDGREAARTIRNLPRKDAKEILIFALSADAFVEDERLSAESGMNGHFAKPIDFTMLEQKIGTFLKER